MDDHAFRITRETDPARLGWDVLGVDLVVEATGSMVEVVGRYDNEWGDAQRTIELADLVAGTLPGR